MQFAVAEDRSRVLPTKGAKALCPICESQVIAKCGVIVVHHWAHEAGCDCDPWFEPETEWHRAWKSLFPLEWVEIPCGEHRADVLTDRGIVVELQNSSISPDEIRAREKCYRRMVWVVNASLFADRIYVMERYGTTNTFKLRWKHSRPCWLYARKPVYLDLGMSNLGSLMGQRFLAVREHPRVPVTKTIQRSFHRPADLEDEIRRSDLLLLNTLHESGWGSVKAMHKASLLRLLGVR